MKRHRNVGFLAPSRLRMTLNEDETEETTTTRGR